MQEYKCNLKKLRNDYHITQKELADAIGTSVKTISTIEHDRSEPTLSMARRISRYMKISMDVIFPYAPGDTVDTYERGNYE